MAVKVGDRVTAGPGPGHHRRLRAAPDPGAAAGPAHQPAGGAEPDRQRHPGAPGHRTPSTRPRRSWTPPRSRSTRSQEADKSAVDRAEKQLERGQEGPGPGRGPAPGRSRPGAPAPARVRQRLSSGLSDDAEKALKKLQSGDTDGAAAALPELTSLLGVDVREPSGFVLPAAGGPGRDRGDQRASARWRPAAPRWRRPGRSRTWTRPPGRCRSRTRGRAWSPRRTPSTRPAPTGPFNIDQQRALVANGQALVRAAQRDVDDATLKAPVDGTVSAINGAVGEFLSPSCGVTAQAPGSDAAIPGTETRWRHRRAAAGGEATATRPGGSQFLVLERREPAAGRAPVRGVGRGPDPAQPERHRRASTRSRT